MNVQETKARLLGLETADDMENMLAELTPEQQDELRDSFTEEEACELIEKMTPQITGLPTEEAEPDLTVKAKLSCVQEGVDGAGGRYIKVVVVLSGSEFSEPQEIEFYATDEIMASLIVQAEDDGHESSSFLLATSQDVADEQTIKLG